MTDTNRKWDQLTAEQRLAAIDELIVFFENEWDKKISNIAAGQLLDHFLPSADRPVYNKGIVDARAASATRLEDLKYDLDELPDL